MPLSCSAFARHSTKSVLDTRVQTDTCITIAAEDVDDGLLEFMVASHTSAGSPGVCPLGYRPLQQK
eukprot:764082-Hanusia_phi.AAC.4